MKTEALNDGANPSWEPVRERAWDELSDIEKAANVAKRLLGNQKISEGEYCSIGAAEDLYPCEAVTIDRDYLAKRWDGTGVVIGITVGVIRKGCFGWIQLKS